MEQAKKTSIPVFVQSLMAVVSKWRVWRTWMHYSDKRGPMLADAITYRALFGVFATVLLAFSLAGILFTSNPEAKEYFITVVDNVIPGLLGPGGLVDPDSIAAVTSFSITGAISLFVLLMAAIAAISSCRTSVEVLCNVKTSQIPFFIGILRDLLFAVFMVLMFALATGIMHFGSFAANQFFDWLGIPSASPWAFWLLSGFSYLLVLLVNMMLIILFYRVFSGMRVREKGQYLGALLGGVALLVLQMFSNFFVRGAADNPLLASFASLIALLLWMNLSAQVILLAVSFVFVGKEPKSSPPEHPVAELSDANTAADLVSTNKAVPTINADAAAPDAAAPDAAAGAN